VPPRLHVDDCSLEVFVDVGVPAGVVNVVFGSGAKAGQALVSHPGTSLVSFTGSTATAHKIRLASAPFCKKHSLEVYEHFTYQIV